MKEQNSALIGNLACFTAYAIFGFSIISCKSIAIDGNITPMALFCLRSFGATVLFWIWSLSTAPHDHIEKKDIWKVAVASFLGLFMTQLSFLFAITKTTAIRRAPHLATRLKDMDMPEKTKQILKDNCSVDTLADIMQITREEFNVLFEDSREDLNILAHFLEQTFDLRLYHHDFYTYKLSVPWDRFTPQAIS